MKKYRIPVLVALVVVALGVVAFVGVSCTSANEESASSSSVAAKKKVEVPDMQYFDKESVEKSLKEAGLELGEVNDEYSTDLPEGFVLKQEPKAGTEVDEGSKVDIVLSKGFTRTTVPDVTGMTPEEAEEAFFKAWIVPVPGDPVYSEGTDPGLVCAQSVQGGQEVDVLKQVVYATSLGKEMVTVPNVEGVNVNDARNALTDAGLGHDTNGVYSDDVAKDNVIDQSIDGGSQVAKGTVVHLQVSLGPKPATRVRIPNVLTYTLDDAKKALESAGLGWSYDGDEDGTVISTSPQVGAEVDQGTVVNLTLQHATEVTVIVVENDFTLTEAEARQVIWEQGLGEDRTAKKVQDENGVWYWQIVAADTEGVEHTYLIDQNRNVTEV